MGQESHRRTDIVGPAEKKKKNGSTERVRAQGPTQKPIEKLMRVFSEATYYRWGRQPWLKRDVKVSRKMWRRPEACPSLRWQINLSVSGELLSSSNPPRGVDLSRQGTSCCRRWPWNFRRPPPPPKRNCVDPAGWTFFPSRLSRSLLNAAWAQLQVSRAPVGGPPAPLPSALPALLRAHAPVIPFLLSF